MAKKHRYTAATADKYELYQLSVQSPEADVEFLVNAYKELRDKNALHMREDFSGTGLLTAHWLKRGPSCTAEAFDNDPEPLAWGREHNFAPLGKDAERAILHEADVREPSRKPPDIRCAQNFSYMIFQTRPEMLDYFRRCYEDLAGDGILVLDLYGGPEAMQEMEEETEQEEGFSYIWDQDEFWPVTHETRTFIHFHFPDGSSMSRAFSYYWRLWTMPELIELLREAGFSGVHAYWEGTDEDGESGNGEYTRTHKGDNDLAWVSYLVSTK